MSRPDDILFVDDAVYVWRSLDEHAVAAYWVGRYKEGLTATQRLLSSGTLPAGERQAGPEEHGLLPGQARRQQCRQGKVKAPERG